MTKGRDNQAARFSDILELIQARRQSGLLSVERFANGQFDEGDIYFQDGWPVYAHSGNLVGEEALAWLANWRQVYFSFVKGAAPPGQHQQKAPRESNPAYGLVPARPDRSPGSIEGLIPRKLLIDQGVLSLPLTRLQRSIYLLVDGRRTVADLARCIGKSVEEVGKLLDELNAHGLVVLERR